MSSDQNEKQTPHLPADDETTQKTDTGSLRQRQPPVYQGTVRIDELPELERSLDWGNAFLGKRAQLSLKVEGHNDAPVQVTIKDQIVLGRVSQNSDETPDLDLAPFNAAQLGVSRRHAVITKEGNMLKVADLSSMNGTYLNGMQLRSNQPRVLRTGDKLNLGQLVLIVVGMA